MAKYGEAAKLATGMIVEADGTMTPRVAWKRAVAIVFPKSDSQQAKNCPRAAFLTLCELGALKGVRSGNYAAADKKRTYMARALEALRSDAALARNQSALWRVATAGVDVAPNGEMDVLCTLWNAGIAR